MRIRVKYENKFIFFMIFCCVVVVGIVIGALKLFPYAMQSISSPNEHLLNPIYDFLGRINWAERGVSFVLLIVYLIWITMMNPSSWVKSWETFWDILNDFLAMFLNWGIFIWLVYRVLITIIKFFTKSYPIVFWIIMGIEVIAFLVPMMITIIVWRIRRRAIIQSFETHITSSNISRINIKSYNESEKLEFMGEPKVGVIVYEVVVDGVRRFMYDSNYLTGLKPIGVVFYVGKTIRIVHISENGKLEWCLENALGRYKEIPTTLNDGRRNMDIIREKCSDFDNDSLYPAFAYIRSLGKDWYMPAKDELNLIYKNKEKINEALKVLCQNGVKADLLSDDVYWSSSSNDDYTAWFQSFSDGRQSYNYELYHYSVRAVRALTI